jgi:soluble lytic murein transglycosylase-like protein
MRSVFALLPAAFIAGALYTLPAEAKCGDDPTACSLRGMDGASHATKVKLRAKAFRAYEKKAQRTQERKTQRTAQTRTLRSKRLKTYEALRVEDEGAGSHSHVVSMIKSMAPSYGVPTWFALRIAKVESGYNPRVRGRAGEIGVFQIKCQTARGLGFRGSCGQLADARTNVQWGLKHLSMAIQSSSGNLQLAASKHNGGLGRKRLVHSYVAKVF